MAVSTATVVTLTTDPMGNPVNQALETYPSLSNVCIATAEVFDHFIGATRLIANPQGLP